jgi:hypothetical protein
VVVAVIVVILSPAGLEARERRDAALGGLVDPAVVDEPDRDRFRKWSVSRPERRRTTRPASSSTRRVLHHSEARHLELGLELAERAPLALEQPVEEVPPRRVGERLEHPVVVHRRPRYVTI